MTKRLSTELCHIATNGLAPNGKDSFAWIINDREGNILAQSKGPVYGVKITSFCSEGYGILSMLRYLLRKKQVHHTEEQAGVESSTLDMLGERITQSQQSHTEDPEIRVRISLIGHPGTNHT
jgi:hypothetical protein